jgi:hypothetical protein
MRRIPKSTKEGEEMAEKLAPKEIVGKGWIKEALFFFLCSMFPTFPLLADGKELPKIAVWDLEPRNTPETHARELTSFVVSEITKLKKYEVYSQENVRSLAGWSAERMKLGCTDTKCLTALGQMDIAKLISGSVGKIGKRYTVSLNLFDTQKREEGDVGSNATFPVIARRRGEIGAGEKGVYDNSENNHN